MKAISLLQPWATLIMLGYKQYETRSWQTSHRGPIAVHASKGKPREAREACEVDPIISAILKKHHLTFDTLPRGAVLGICHVGRMHSTNKLPHAFSLTELACGDYSPDRYAWEMDFAREAASPVPCAGSLSVWEVPPHVAHALRCPACYEELNPDAVSPCFCDGQAKPEPDGEPSYTDDGHPY